MTETPSAQLLPPHFSCDCVPDLGPKHCHRCSQIAGSGIVEWENAPCREMVEGFTYSVLLTARSDAALLLVSDAFDAECQAPAVAIAETPACESLADPAIAVGAIPTPTKPVPRPSKVVLLSAHEGQEMAATSGPWRFTNLARDQFHELELRRDDIVRILEEPHVTTPSQSGTATNHFGEGLLIMVDEDEECVISIIKRHAPAAVGSASYTDAPFSTKSPALRKAHSGGAGRRIPSNWKEFLTALTAHGFTTELGGKGHHLTVHPLHPDVRISVPGSPSDNRSYMNAVADIKRRTGIDITKSKD
ncbi:hypothetical protein [Cryobacterium zhongshanensis]|uniref:Uncharacterized protein n=1 Tax=Cryobacterium zhongshanensis TaxID=2928153 RepID=A0AA41QZJ5_9MICO|nr:hypothetical protein [Cryobacterium zhongshanensis]MCI4659763.1 hypothetical protein [Cryobacterium zhongshanensis]